MAIEISNQCNANCPVCLGDNRSTFEMSLEEIRGLVEQAIRDQEHIGVLTVSGGEPTIHPQFFHAAPTPRLLRGRNPARPDGIDAG